MKAAALAAPRASRWGAFFELTKPRLSFFVLVVVFVVAWLASAGRPDLAVVLHAVLGTALVAAGGSAINMFLERRQDALMPRTWGRPLPSGRLRPGEVLAFGVVTATAGVVDLFVWTTPLAAFLGALTFALYVGVYTPLKRRTTLNTHVGAIPGALPVLLGWAAVRGSLELPAWALFFVLFLWQIPHFLAIAWLYRDDYERGGFRMLPVVDRDGAVTGRQAVVACLALLPLSLLLVQAGVTGYLYLAGALLAGGWFTLCAIRFARRRERDTARRLLKASLVYLPLLLLLVLADRVA